MALRESGSPLVDPVVPFGRPSAHPRRTRLVMALWLTPLALAFAAPVLYALYALGVI